MTSAIVPRFWSAPPGTYGGGQETDPVAALIGKGLQAFGAVRTARQQEQDRQDRLQQQGAQEQSEADWRNFQKAMQLNTAGLTTTAPTPAGPPTKGAAEAPLDRPVESVGGVNYFRAGPSAAEQKATDTDARTRVIHQRVGHALAQQMFGHDVDDDTAEGIGTNPQAFAGFQKFQETPPKNFAPVGEGAGAFDPVTGKVKPTGFTPPQRGAGTPQMMQHAEFGTGAMAAWQKVEQLRTQYPQVEAEVGKIMSSPAFVHAVPLVKSSADMVQLLQRAGASDAAQRYMRAKWPFLDNVIRTRIPGGRMSGPLFAQVQNEFMPSLDPAGNAQIRANEIQAMLTAQGESGFDQNPDTWNRAAKRHGVDNIDLQAALQGRPWDRRALDIHSRYPVKRP